MNYGRPLTILAIIGISTASLYAYNIKTPEQRLIESIRLQNVAIDESNDAKIDTYRSILDKCQQSASGTSREILQKYADCSQTPKPILQEYVGSSGSIEGVSKGNNNVEESTATGSVIPVPLGNSIEGLQVKICNKQKNSPLCKDKELLARLYKITEDRLPGKNFFPILIGITNAESSLGLNFASDNVGGKCTGRNNWGGTKYQILDDNTRVYARSLNGFNYSNSKDQYGCNLFPFKSIEEFWTTKVNGMRFGYKGCIDNLTPIYCLSGPYVGSREVHEQSWINNVSIFLN